MPDGEVQSVGGDEPQVKHVSPSLGHALDESFLQRLAGEPHVAGHDDPRAREPQVVDVGPPDVPGEVFIQGVGIHAPYVVRLED